MRIAKNKYTSLIGSMYTNFIFQGMAAIILAQNLPALMSSWNASLQEVTLVMSGIGLGRIVILYFAGYFSDKFGRKKTVQIGIISYFVFFLGMLISQNYLHGLFFSLFGGFSNAFLDTSTYPTLVEAFPSEKDNCSLSVLNKAFISIGQFILPFFTRWLLTNQLYFGWVFIGCALCLAINLVYLSRKEFPPLINTKEVLVERETIQGQHKPNFKIEGIALLVFSFTSVSTFNIFILWIPKFAESLKLVSQADSLIFVSVYSLGSFVSVFVTSLLVKRGVSSTLILITGSLVSLILLIGMTVFPSVPMFLVASAGVGVFAAGGIWQIGLAILLDLFPQRKGKTTSYYSLATSVSVMITPYVTGLLGATNTANIFWYNIILTAVAVLAALVVNYRYKKIMAPSFVMETT
ncbi:MFS transporter [Vagococcus sp. BWB3-3]|uniref:MFS transporter n=1 Tax=Vagococcus allomyrinae TaxID=2794353 RepID=A0A940PC01_9ENTE|nr:MFS transporter [Vagococcus allomyrinae]MBP1041747.1 MFS transporter [Vagococcus allomyrinae]